MSDADALTRARLKSEADEFDHASRTYLASKRLSHVLVDRSINSDYLMAVRFNHLLDVLESRVGIASRSVLSCGCGAGLYEIALAQRGATVFAYDFSEGMLDIARHNTTLHGARVTLFKADELSLSTKLAELGHPCIDLVFGASILHHIVDLETYGNALATVCQPSIVALFIEPLATPITDWARQSKLNPTRAVQTTHERPWTHAAYLAFLGRLFRHVECLETMNLFSGLYHSSARTVLRRIGLRAHRAIKLDRLVSRLPGLSLLSWHGAFLGIGLRDPMLEL